MFLYISTCMAMLVCCIIVCSRRRGGVDFRVPMLGQKSKLCGRCARSRQTHIYGNHHRHDGRFALLLRQREISINTSSMVFHSEPSASSRMRNIDWCCVANWCRPVLLYAPSTNHVQCVPPSPSEWHSNTLTRCAFMNTQPHNIVCCGVKGVALFHDA